MRILFIKFEKAILKSRELEIPMLCRTNDGFIARDFRAGIDEFGLVEICAAIIALVAARLCVAADGTGAFDLSVGQKHFCLFVI